MADNSNHHAWYEGSVDELMAPGSAIEFIQPWHIPVSTTPANTGMSLGGIGSAVTVTPAGTTPSIHFLPGRYIESRAETPVRMTDFFYGETPCRSFDLQVEDHQTLKLYIQVLPLVKADGEQWLSDQDTEQVIENKFREIVESPDFYPCNKNKLAEWGVTLSQKTRHLIDAFPGKYKELNYNLLLDLFPGCITNREIFTTSLTGDIEEECIGGYPCYPSGFMHYRGLYPVSETEYTSTSHRCRIKKTHVSPVIAENYKSCSLPLLHTQFLIENPADESVEISILQIQENITGYEILKSRRNDQDAVFSLQRAINGQTGEVTQFQTPDGGRFHGVVMYQEPGARRGDLDGRICLGAYVDPGFSDVEVTAAGCDFAPNGVANFDSVLLSGRIVKSLRPMTYSGKERTSGGVCVRATLRPGESVTINFVTLLDFPTISLGDYVSQKKYTHYFPDRRMRLENVVSYYFCGHDAPLQRIKADPKALAFPGILNRYRRTGSCEAGSGVRLATMFANGFSFLAEATVWDVDNNFYVRECVDYPFFNSLDVYFYGSFGILYLLPDCDTHNVMAFSRAVFLHDDTPRRHSVYHQADFGELSDRRYSGIRKQRGAVPHDMGNPIDPSPNAYTWHDVVHWKDLAPKFVLLVYRNYLFTGNIEILTGCWPAVVESIEFLRGGIGAGHCIPLASGTDDTFDNITSYGISVYSASLWVAGLKAASKIAEIIDIPEKREEYSEIATAARTCLRDALWDEELGCYHHFSAPITEDDIDKDLIDKAPALLERLEGEPHSGPVDLEKLITCLNRYIYSNETHPQHAADDAEGGGDAKASAAADKGHREGFKERKENRKRRIVELSEGLVNNGFRGKVSLESDDIFADQLLADLYLSLLQLEPITPRQDRIRALNTIYQTNYEINSPAAGAANAVTREGKSLPDFQAQDVWLGIQFSLAASMIDCEMVEKFDGFVIKLYENIYHAAKIPFGVPEGFNCDGSLGREDLTYGLKISNRQAAVLLEQLRHLGVTSPDGMVNRLLLQQADIRKKLKDCLAGAGVPATLAGSLQELLNACFLKFTAGRYFRPGMLYSILAVADNGAGRFADRAGGAD